MGGRHGEVGETNTRHFLSNEQGERFLDKGAVGSHLENIERREGYKGFNRKNVSTIIRQTDPRKNIAYEDALKQLVRKASIGVRS